MTTIKNRLAGFLAAPAIAAAVLGGTLTMAAPASAAVSTNDNSSSGTYGAHPNTQIVVTPNTYARPSVFVPWPGWYN